MPTGTLQYADPPTPGPAQVPCSANCPRRPLADVVHGPNVHLAGGCAPLVGAHCQSVLRGPKVECTASLAAGHKAMGEAVAAACSQWYPAVGGASGNLPARFPVDEIEVDFTVADFNMDL
eukprot:g22917.t1